MCLVGFAVIVLLLVTLDPVMRYEDCPNYGANGNASAFDNPDWDLYFPLVLLGWVSLVIVEQVLPVTWRHRSDTEIAIRALSAITASVTLSCCLFLKFAAVCR
ncbi:hypothetical protein GCM10010399_33740 [Dactylosporangium fulvum]